MSLVIVVGGPKTGKTSWSYSHGRAAGLQVRHTDSLIATHDWSQASEEVARWITVPGDWLIEGVATARALRKWLVAHPGERLDASVVIFTRPFVPLTKGQQSMAKGVDTVWREIEAEVRARGAIVSHIEDDETQPVAALDGAA